MLETGRDENGQPLSDVDKAYIWNALPGRERVWAEFKPLTGRLRDLTPNVAFNGDLGIDIGNRQASQIFGARRHGRRRELVQRSGGIL